MRIAPMVVVGALLLLSGCSKPADEVSPPANGPVVLAGGGERDYANAVFLTYPDDPRNWALGDIALDNSAFEPATVHSVSLREAYNVELTEDALIPISADATDGFGAGLPMPAGVDSEAAKTATALWEQRTPLETPIASDQTVLLVPLVKPKEQAKCGWFRGLDVTYTVAGNEYVLEITGQTYILQPEQVGEGGCTAS